jgi:hypothetical protein
MRPLDGGKGCPALTAWSRCINLESVGNIAENYIKNADRA